MTSGQVISGAGSPGQQICAGSLPRSMSSPIETHCWTGAAVRVRGRVASTARARGSLCHASFRLCGGRGARSSAISAPSSSSRSVLMPSPHAIRSIVPKRFVRSGISDGVPSALIGCSNSSAGPCSRSSRRWISVTSWTTETLSRMRRNCPLLSMKRRKSDNSRKRGTSRCTR
jgi:hypothetical protein